MKLKTITYSSLFLAISTNAFAQSGRSLPSGELGNDIGCTIAGVFFPENGACLEKRFNKERWDQYRQRAQELGGGGVLNTSENPLDFEFDHNARFDQMVDDIPTDPPGPSVGEDVDGDIGHQRGAIKNPAWDNRRGRMQNCKGLRVCQ